MKKIFIYLLAFPLFLSCGNNKNETPVKNNGVEENIVTLTKDQLVNAELKIGSLQMKTISSVLKVTGKVDVPPQNMVSISVPLGGYLISTKLLAGMHVQKGEVLAVMQDQQYIQLQQDYLIAKAQLIFSEGEFARQKELNNSKAISDKVFEQTKANYHTQNILIKSLEEKLKLIGLNPTKINVSNISKSINIYSPINGYVAAVNVNIGKYVNPSDILFELVNPEDIHLSLTIFEKDINKLFIGQKLIAYNNSDPSIKHHCSILLISKKISEDRSVEVHCHFNDYDKTLLPGMFMNADIELKSHKSKVLPTDAVVRYNNKQYVFMVLNEHQFEMKEIKIGFSENGFTEIKLQPEDESKSFVISGVYNLLMKQKNTVEE